MARISAQRRRWWIGLATAVALVLTACTPDGQAPPQVHKSATAGPVLLQMAVYGPPQVITAYAKIAADFTAEHPQIVVNVRPFDSHREAMRALRKSVEKGEPPNLFLAGAGDLPRLDREGIVRRVDDILGARQVDFGDGFVRGALEAFSAHAALQCMPVNYSPMVVYYNTHLVHLGRLTAPGTTPVDADHGWSIDQFAKAARRASRHGNKGVYVEPSLAQVAPFIWSGGGDLVDDPAQPTTLTLADGASRQALERLLELVRKPRLTFDEGQLTRRSALDRFESGRLGMILGFRDLTPKLRQQKRLDFDVMPLPRLSHRATVAHGDGMCVAQGTPHLDETADFLAYLTSDDAMKVLAQTGYVMPTNLNVSNSDFFDQPDQMPAHAQVFNSQLRYAQLLPAPPRWKQVVRMSSNVLERLFFDPVIDPLDERLDHLDEQSASILVPPSSTESPSPSSTPKAPTSESPDS